MNIQEAPREIEMLPISCEEYPIPYVSLMRLGNYEQARRTISIGQMQHFVLKGEFQGTLTSEKGFLDRHRSYYGPS